MASIRNLVNKDNIWSDSIEAFTIYGQRMEKINSLKRQLEFLRK